LGYLIDSNGIQPLPEKVAVITNFKLPGTIKDLQRFLGMVNYYRRFIPHAAEAQLKLQNILSGKNKKTGAKILLWTEELKRAFDTCKQTLADATLLVSSNIRSTVSTLCRFIRLFSWRSSRTAR
jgi:hypothetical protein